MFLFEAVFLWFLDGSCWKHALLRLAGPLAPSSSTKVCLGGFKQRMVGEG